MRWLKAKKTVASGGVTVIALSAITFFGGAAAAGLEYSALGTATVSTHPIPMCNGATPCNQ